MKNSQSTLYEHSEVKVRLLNLYIQKYLNIMSRAAGIEKVHLYDLFCGEGIYANGGKGSPIIFLKAIKDIYFRNHAGGQKLIQVDCVFNDIETWKTEKLKSIIETQKLHYPFLGELKFRNLDYANATPRVVDQISKSKKSNYHGTNLNRMDRTDLESGHRLQQDLSGL